MKGTSSQRDRLGRTHLGRFLLGAGATGFLGIAVAVSPTEAQESPEPAAIVLRAGELYSAAEAFCADFRQELHVPLLDQRAEGRGRLCQRRPNLFSMRFTEPQGDLVVVDGSSAWVYYPSRDPEQVLKAPVSGSGRDASIDFHREFLEDAEAKYEMEYRGLEEIEGLAVHRVLLRPRADTRYAEAELWIGASTPRVHRVEIREENGSIRRIHLYGIDLAPAIPEGTFSFVPPPGTRVITL
jgi:outer membrane lipoprotein carrier protein